jgi:cytochrome b/TolA-binding protein
MNEVAVVPNLQLQPDDDELYAAPAPYVVWDLPVRIVHVGLVAGVIAAWFTASDDRLHGIVGTLIAGLVAFRVFWGFVGTRHSRFSDFVASPAVIVRSLTGRDHGRRYVGHTPAGGALMLAFLAVLTVMCGTGFALTANALPAGSSGGTLLRQAHMGSLYALFGIIGLHLLAMASRKYRDRGSPTGSTITGKTQPAIGQLMISGPSASPAARQTQAIMDSIRSTNGLMALLLVSVWSAGLGSYLTRDRNTETAMSGLSPSVNAALAQAIPGPAGGPPPEPAKPAAAAATASEPDAKVIKAEYPEDRQDLQKLVTKALAEDAEANGTPKTVAPVVATPALAVQMLADRMAAYREQIGKLQRDINVLRVDQEQERDVLRDEIRQIQSRNDELHKANTELQQQQLLKQSPPVNAAVAAPLPAPAAGPTGSLAAAPPRKVAVAAPAQPAPAAPPVAATPVSAAPGPAAPPTAASPTGICNANQKAVTDYVRNFSSRTLRSAQFRTVPLENKEVVFGRRGKHMRIDLTKRSGATIIFGKREFGLRNDDAQEFRDAMTAVSEALLDRLDAANVPYYLYFRGGADSGDVLGTLPADAEYFRRVKYLPSERTRKGYSPKAQEQIIGARMHNDHLPVLRAAYGKGVIANVRPTVASHTHILQGSPNTPAAEGRSIHLILALTDVCEAF